MKKFAPDLKILMYYNLSQQKKKNFVTNLLSMSWKHALGNMISHNDTLRDASSLGSLISEALDMRL